MLQSKYSPWYLCPCLVDWEKCSIFSSSIYSTYSSSRWHVAVWLTSLVVERERVPDGCGVLWDGCKGLSWFALSAGPCCGVMFHLFFGVILGKLLVPRLKWSACNSPFISIPGLITPLVSQNRCVATMWTWLVLGLQFLDLESHDLCLKVMYLLAFLLSFLLHDFFNSLKSCPGWGPKGGSGKRRSVLVPRVPFFFPPSQPRRGGLQAIHPTMPFPPANFNLSAQWL